MFRLEVEFEADDESEARRIARVMIADLVATHAGFRHGDPPPTAILTKPRERGGAFVVPL